MYIPLTDLQRLHERIRPELEAAKERVLEYSSFVGGEEVAQFEKEFAVFLGVKHAVGVGNGTDAILLSLLVAGIGAGDEVITTSLSAFPTAEAILRSGATPVYVDVNSTTCNIDSLKIESAITKKTKAIVPVHLYGFPAEMDHITAIAKAYNLLLIEDCCQAHGAKWKSRYVGTFGFAGCFSFYPTKNLGCWGDGGAVVTNHDKVAKKIRILRNHGEEGGRFTHRYVGFNSRLDGLQAAILRVKLAHLDEYTKERQYIANRYRREFTENHFFLPPHLSIFPAEAVFHLYVIRVLKRERREKLREYLLEKGIQTNVHYPIPLHHQPAYRVATHLPVVEKMVEQIVSIPLFPFMEEQEIAYVIDCLNKWRA